MAPRAGPTTRTPSIRPFGPATLTASAAAYWPGWEMLRFTLGVLPLPNRVSKSRGATCRCRFDTPMPTVRRVCFVAARSAPAFVPDGRGEGPRAAAAWRAAATIAGYSGRWRGTPVWRRTGATSTRRCAAPDHAGSAPGVGSPGGSGRVGTGSHVRRSSIRSATSSTSLATSSLVMRDLALRGAC